MSKPEKVVILLDQTARTDAGKRAFPFDGMTGVTVLDKRDESRVRVTLLLDQEKRRAAGKNPWPFNPGYMTGVTVESNLGEYEQSETRTFTVTVTALPSDLPGEDAVAEAMADLIGGDGDIAVEEQPF